MRTFMFFLFFVLIFPLKSISCNATAEDTLTMHLDKWYIHLDNTSQVFRMAGDIEDKNEFAGLKFAVGVALDILNENLAQAKFVPASQDEVTDLESALLYHMAVSKKIVTVYYELADKAKDMTEEEVGDQYEILNALFEEELNVTLFVEHMQDEYVRKHGLNANNLIR